MKRIFLFLLLSTLSFVALLFFIPLKAYAASCEYCPPDAGYETPGVVLYQPDLLKHDNSCNSFSDGEPICWYASRTPGASPGRCGSIQVGETCTGTTTCVAAGTCGVTPPPSSSSCNVSLVNGVDMGGCSGNQQPNPACAQNEVCIDNHTPTAFCGQLADGSYSGTCVPNTSGVCTGDPNCAIGYVCTSGHCRPPPNPPVGGEGREGGFPNDGPDGPGTGITIPHLSELGIAGIPTGGIGTLNNVLGVAITLLMIAAIILSLLYIIWGGFFWITSEGDKQRLNQAKQRIAFAIIGLIVVFLAYGIISIVTNFFHVTPTG